MPEFEEWKYAREALLDEVMNLDPRGGFSYDDHDPPTADLLGFGTLTLKVVDDPEAGAFDGEDDVHGTLVWPDGGGWVHGGWNERRPPGVDGSGRKFDTRQGPVWWMPPADVKGDPKILEACAERARRFLREDWSYVGLVLTVDRPHEASTQASLWRIESDMPRADAQEILDGLFSELPPAPPLDPVWIVIRMDGVEVDVFNNEAAAEEHARRVRTSGTLGVFVREESVCAAAWMPQEASD